MKKIGKFLSAFIKTRWVNRWNSREQLLSYQEREIKKQFEYFQKFSPYFKNNNLINEIEMNKDFMMENFDELNTVGIKKEKALKIALKNEKIRNFEEKYNGISVGLSSGTSGHRGLFITCEDEQAVWAGTILAKLLPEWSLFWHRIAFFLRADNYLYKSVNSVVISLKYFDILEDIDIHIAKLNRFQPTILVAPASMLILLGEEKKKGILKINPQKVISVAEILEEKDSKFIAQCFSVKFVHQVYQATEGFLGYTCSCGVLHLNEDIIKFEKEYIDEKRFYPIITDLKRTSQPFINYHLNDILVENTEPCKCGLLFQRIDKIEGRADDLFKFKNKNNKIINIFPDFIRRCLLFVDDIREYQVVQVDFNKIEVSVLNIKEEQKEKITDEFKKLLTFFNIDEESVAISFVEYNLDKKIKLKRIHQKMKKGLDNEKNKN